MQTSAVWPLFSVKVEREDIAVDVMHSITVPDEKWTFVDRKGHGHFWKLFSKKPSTIPTCNHVVVGTEWVGDEYDGEEYEVFEWQCKECGQTIEPGYRQQAGPTHVPGPTYVTVEINDNTFVLTPEEYAESVEGWLEAVRKVAGRR